MKKSIKTIMLGGGGSDTCPLTLTYEIHPVEETIRFKNIRYGHITNFGFSNWKLSGILFVRWNDNGLACSKPIIIEDDISSYIINLDDFK